MCERDSGWVAVLASDVVDEWLDNSTGYFARTTG
jgi:hypothetical protein